MFHYRAFELTFASAIELPDIVPLQAAPPQADVTIRLGAVPDALPGQQDRESWFQTTPDRTLLHIDEVGRYLIEDGARITVAPVATADPDMVRLFLLGSATGALLYQRGLLPLHGSAVEADGGAMVFVGPQGIGKSTLAAHFGQRGYRILGDDVCVVAVGLDGELQVLPAFPKLRLCPDALERLGRSTATLNKARFDGDKFVVPITGNLCPHPLPLRAIHLLSAGYAETITIRPFLGFARADGLLSNLYRPELLPGLNSAASVCALAITTTTRTRLIEIVHNRDAGRIEELVDRLEQEWKTASRL